MGPCDRLNNYLDQVRDTPFEWGVHDCFTFTNAAWHAMHGTGWADDWIGQYLHIGGRHPLSRHDLRRVYGFDTFEKAADSRLARCPWPVPPRGALVTGPDTLGPSQRRWGVGVAMGIAVGMNAAFLSMSGLVYLPIETIKYAWIPHEP